MRSIGEFFDIPEPAEIPTHFAGDAVRIRIDDMTYPAVITRIVNRIGALSYDVDTEAFGPTWVFPDQIVRLS